MEENEKTASEIARGIHPRGYGAIMSFTGTREFTARVNGLSFRFTKGTDLNHVSVHRNGGQRVHRGVLHDGARTAVKATTQRHRERADARAQGTLREGNGHKDAGAGLRPARAGRQE